MTVQGFTDQSKIMASQILAEDNADASTYNDGLYSSHVMYMHPPVYSSYPMCGPSYRSGGGSSNSNDNGGAILLGIGAVVAGLVTLYHLGSDWGLKRNVDADLQNLSEQRAFCELEAKSEGSQAKVDMLYNKQEKILNMIKSDVSWGLYTKVAFLLSAATVLTGAVLTSATVAAAIPVATAAATPLMVGGVVGGTVSLGTILFRSGFNSTTNQVKKEAESLYQMADAIQNNDNRKLA